jgi:hypothetical protein
MKYAHTTVAKFPVVGVLVAACALCCAVATVLSWSRESKVVYDIESSVWEALHVPMTPQANARPLSPPVPRGRWLWRLQNYLCRAKASRDWKKSSPFANVDPAQSSRRAD